MLLFLIKQIEFRRKEIDGIVLPKEVLESYRKPTVLNVRKANVTEKIFKYPKQNYNL